MPIDQGTLALLRAHLEAQDAERQQWGDAWQASDLVFTRECARDHRLAGMRTVRPALVQRRPRRGHPLRRAHPDAVSKGFGVLVGKYALPRISLHGLRHTSASVQIAAGVPIEIVSKRLRHANVKITSDVYSHLVGTVGKEAAEATAALIGQYRKTV